MFFTQSISQSFISSSCCTVHLFGAVFSQSLSQIFWSCAIRPFPVFPVYTADVWCSATDAGAVLRKNYRHRKKICQLEKCPSKILYTRLAESNYWDVSKKIVSYQLTSSMSWGSEFRIFLFNK